MSDLKPCPFCNETPTLSAHFKEEMWRLIHRCPVMGSIVLDWSTRESISRRWNTRALTPEEE